MSNPRQRRARGADHPHFNDMRTQINPAITAPYEKKVRKRIVLGRIAKRMQVQKKINKIVGDRKVVQWEVTCKTGAKYYVCAVNEENAMRSACRYCSIPEESILSVKLYNDPI